MKNAIILFVRNPEPGKVKTRLAREIGDAAALKVYIQLLQHTHAITCGLACDKFVWYADYISRDDIWEMGNYRKQIQSGADLGERMQKAFNYLFESGYQKIVIIGSDCPGLSAEIIDTAFEQLNYCSAVVGPAKDGGYYLLGLTNMIEALFKNKNWSTDAVLTDSLADLINMSVKYTLLPVLQDIDTKEDLLQLNYTIPG